MLQGEEDKIQAMKDLHIHTKYSDGEFDEKQILEQIEIAGITEFAICDHDTIMGSQKVFELFKKPFPKTQNFGMQNFKWLELHK